MDTTSEEDIEENGLLEGCTAFIICFCDATGNQGLMNHMSFISVPFVLGIQFLKIHFRPPSLPLRNLYAGQETTEPDMEQTVSNWERVLIGLYIITLLT